MTHDARPEIAAESPSARANAETVLRFFRDVLGPAGADAAAFLHPGFRDNDPAPGTPPGPQGVAAKLAVFRAAFPDGRFETEIVVAAGDLVSVRSRFVGTQTGPFGPLAPGGRAVSVTFHDFYQMRDGLISGHWHVFDQAGMMAQLSGS